MSSPKIAIVCDFLTVMGGAENVVLAMHELFPDAPIYTAIYNPDKLPAFKGLDIRTSYLQKFPAKLRKYHKLFPTLAVRAMQKLDLSDYDIILTSTYLHGHQVTKSRPDQVVIAYCHTPARYYWSHYQEYRQNPGFGALNWPVRLAMPLIVPRQRKLDLIAAAKVDTYIANSSEVQSRIQKYYGRSSTVIHPPVEVSRFTPSRQRDDYYVALGRQLPYKRIDLAVAVATKLNIKLKVFGSGPEHDKLVAMAGPTVEFYTDRFGDASDEAVEQALNNAKGYIFPAEEDFGIVQVEAMAAGAPVVAYGKGGALDIVEDGISGVLFAEQTVDSLAQAIKKAESINFLPGTLRRKAKRFDKNLFKTKLRKIVNDSIPLTPDKDE